MSNEQERSVIISMAIPASMADKLDGIRAKQGVDRSTFYTGILGQVIQSSKPSTNPVHPYF